MALDALAHAIRGAVDERLYSTSDRIVRVNVPRNWPVAEAFQSATKDELHIICQRPFSAQGLSGIIAPVSEDVSRATAFRNDRSRDFAVVVLGYVTEEMDAGLKQLAVVDRSLVVDYWRRDFLASLSEGNDASKPEAVRLYDALFDQVKQGSLDGIQLAGYLTAVAATPTVETLSAELWRIDLCADHRVIDTSRSRSRLASNRNAVTQLKNLEDRRVEERLRRGAQSTRLDVARIAKSAQRFRATENVALLRGIELDTLLDILGDSGIKPPKRDFGLLDLLNASSPHAEAVRGAVSGLAAAWQNDRSNGELAGSVKLGNETMRVRVPLPPPPTSNDDDEEEVSGPWTEDTDLGQALFGGSAGDMATTLDEATKVMRASRAIENLRLLDGNVDLEPYLGARARLRPFEYYLANWDPFMLLFLDDTARAAVSDVLDEWRKLARQVLENKVAKGVVQIIQSLETIQHLPQDGSDGPKWITLGPLHPYILDPALRVAERAREMLASEQPPSSLGDAVDWMIDRSSPAYPIVHVKSATLYRDQVNSHVVYRAFPESTAPVARDAAGLLRLLNSVRSYSPWLDQGFSVLVVDPPVGTGVAQALSRLSSQLTTDEALHVYHLATRPGVDSLEGFDGDLAYLRRASSLATADGLPQVDVVLRFAPEPASSQYSTADWQATRGSHLSLSLTYEDVGGPFDGAPSPEIVIDPRAGNSVVLLMQEMYRAVSGGTRPLAAIKPLLETDDAASLSKLGDITDWVIFASPGPLGLVSPGTINSTLRYVGRGVAGRYGLYVYSADRMYSVRRRFEDFLKHTPSASVPQAKLVDQLVDRAQESAGSILHAGRKIQYRIGELVGLRRALDSLGSHDFSVALALDDLGWTRAWLGDGLRADFVVASFDLTQRTVQLTVVECKTDSTSDPISPDSKHPHLTEAQQQVTATLAVLKQIATSPEPLLDEDLRFSSLVEHLMAHVLNQHGELEANKGKALVEMVNAFARRDIVPSIRGLVVLTQSKINSQTKIHHTSDSIDVVWAGAPETARILGSDALSEAVEGSSQLSETQEGTSPDTHEPSVAKTVGPSGPGEPSDQPTEPTSSALPESLPADDGDSGKHRDLARSFISAARLHGLAVDDSEPQYIRVGPTLMSFGIRVEEGETLQPLRARIGDIARDIGMGDRAGEITFENDAEPRTVRIMLPRANRTYPKLPTTKPRPIGRRGYLPVFLGQDADGRDFESAVEAWPHMLVAGTTGSGKTTFVSSLIKQLVGIGPEYVELAIADGKGDTDYLDLVPPELFPEAFPDVQLGAERALEVMQWAVEQLELRRKLLHEIAAGQLDRRRLKASDLFREAAESRVPPPMRPLVVMVDEFADIMLQDKAHADEFVGLVQRIAQVGRSRMLHLVLATQRPDRQTIRGSIKSNLDARVVLRLPTQADSLTVLGQAGAERLLSHGDLLFRHGTGTPIRLQGYADEAN